MHARLGRWTQLDGAWRKATVFRLRCPGCRLTTVLLPEGMLPAVQFDLDTIAAVVAEYLTSRTSYRRLPFVIGAVIMPADLTATTIWGTDQAPSPTPSSCFRWVARFCAGASAWWPLLVARLQDHVGAGVRPLGSAFDLAAKARTAAKRDRLQWGHQLVAVAEALATALGIRQGRWPYLVLHAPSVPAALDHTRWFARPP